MPTYEFQCDDCKQIIELRDIKMKDCPKEITCMDCHAPARKIISSSSFHLKGGGWYADGYGCGTGKKKAEGG